jgi:two-component system, NtrC family, sensor kinase
MTAEPIHVLLIERDAAQGASVERQLVESGVAPFEVEHILHSNQAIERLDEDHIDVVLLHLSSTQTMEVLPKVQQRAPSMPVVVLGEDENEVAAVEAVRGGAQDYLVGSNIDGRTLAHGLRYAIERKRAEEALQKSEAFYHSLVESLPQNIFRKDLTGRFTFANRRFCAAMNKPLDQIVGRSDFDFFPPELAAKYRADDLQVIETGKIFDTVERYMTPEGETLHVQVLKTPVYDASGKLIGTQGIFWDITERVRNEEQLRQACGELAAKEGTLRQTMEMLRSSHEELIQAQLQLIQAEKLESVGRLAAGVAHEVKNPLAIMLMGVEYLAEGDMRDPSADQEVMRAMREAVHRANAIVRGLVDFSANRQLDATPQDLNAMINRSLLLVKHELIGAHVDVCTELAPQLPQVLLDGTRIQQVFVNLFMNAIHAMASGGTLTVRTHTRRLEAPVRDGVPLHSERFRLGDTAVIAEVEDTGTGIPPDKISKVFDPFFTTKAAGRGTGLGLTVTQKIIDLHDGAITIANRHGPGGQSSKPIGARVTLTFKAYGSSTHGTHPQQAGSQAHSHC